MKINGAPNSLPTDRPVAKRELPEAERPAGPGSTRVSVSELAVRLQSLESEFAAGEPFDARKVEELKQAIREGRFQVNAGVVADRLLQDARDLLDPR